MHYGPEQPRIQTEVLGLSLICSLVRSHRSLVCLFRTVHTLLRTLARSLTLLLPSSWESELLDHYFFCGFFFFTIVTVSRVPSIVSIKDHGQKKKKSGIQTIFSVHFHAGILALLRSLFSLDVQARNAIIIIVIVIIIMTVIVVVI